MKEERGKGEGSCKKGELEIGIVSHLNEFEEIRAVKNTKSWSYKENLNQNPNLLEFFFYGLKDHSL